MIVKVPLQFISQLSTLYSKFYLHLLKSPNTKLFQLYFVFAGNCFKADFSSKKGSIFYSRSTLLLFSYVPATVS